jgi:hypothetical protein
MKLKIDEHLPAEQICGHRASAAEINRAQRGTVFCVQALACLAEGRTAWQALGCVRGRGSDQAVVMVVVAG